MAIVLRVHDVLDSILQDMPPDNINLSIYEHFALPTERAMYQNQRELTAAGLSGLWALYQPPPETLQVVKSLTPLGQQWQVVFKPTAVYMAHHALWYHWFVWVCGLLGTGGIAAYLYLVLNRNFEAERMVRDRTAQLHQANTQLQATMQELQERQQHEKAVVEEELARVRNRLVANTRLATLGQIAATIAHELRNPLGAVRNAVFYIRRYLAKDQQELLEFLQIIDVEVTTADRIITDLLEMSRAKTPSMQQLDLCIITQEIWRQMNYQDIIRFRLAVTQEPFWLWADAIQFRQILTNLLTNAVQAMPHGGDLSLCATYQGNDVVVTLQDSGPGVPPALRDQIFEPLFTTKAKGTGLGLTLCRQIMKRHGGTIQVVDSEQGARFELRLPNQPNPTVQVDHDEC